MNPPDGVLIMPLRLAALYFTGPAVVSVAAIHTAVFGASVRRVLVAPTDPQLFIEAITKNGEPLPLAQVFEMKLARDGVALPSALFDVDRTEMFPRSWRLAPGDTLGLVARWYGEGAFAASVAALLEVERQPWSDPCGGAS